MVFRIIFGVGPHQSTKTYEIPNTSVLGPTVVKIWLVVHEVAQYLEKIMICCKLPSFCEKKKPQEPEHGSLQTWLHNTL